MNQFIKFLCPVFALAVLLSACIQTTVIDDSQRELPEGAESFEGADQPPIVVPDMTQSFIAFKGGKGGIMEHEGTFTGFDFKMALDENAPTDITKASIGLLISIQSLVTDSKGLTSHLLNEDFFEAETYPNATFFSSAIQRTEGNTYEIVGDLTMKGIEQEIAFTAEITDKYLITEPYVNREDFGVGAPESENGIDQQIPMEIQIVFATGQEEVEEESPSSDAEEAEEAMDDTEEAETEESEDVE